MGRRPDAVMEQLREEILVLWLEHAFIEEIAEEVGVTTSTIWRYTQSAGLGRGKGKPTLLGRYRWRWLPEPRQTRSGIQLVEAMRDEKGNAPPCSQCPAAGQCAEWARDERSILLPCERPLLPWELSRGRKRAELAGLW